jgi:uncharacterized protein YrrD
VNTNRDEMTITEITAVGRETPPAATSDLVPEAGSKPGQTGEGGIPITSSELKGKAVISITSGARLGRVDDVLFDPASLDVAAFRVSAGGQQAVIPFDQVQSVGRDAVMVPSDDVAQWIATSNAGAGLLSFDDLKHRKVVDDAGTLLGTPRAIDVAPQDGRLQQLQVHMGGMLGMGGETTIVASRDLVSVGADVIVVHAATAQV